MKPKHTINVDFPDEQFITRVTDGENVYFPSFLSPEDAVDSLDDDNKQGFVATYKLVKVEKLKLVRTTNVVKVK